MIDPGVAKVFSELEEEIGPSNIWLLKQYYSLIKMTNPEMSEEDIVKEFISRIEKISED